MYNCFRPGKTWYDTEGKRIQAHGGSIIYVNGVYYWYGENKEGITGYATGTKCPEWHHGVRLYSSTDLYNWEDLGVIYVEEDPNGLFYPTNIMDRPHIIYNAKTDKFVMWAKCASHGFVHSNFGVCIADKITGPYTFLAEVSCAPHYVGDFDLVEWDGKAYAIFEHPHTHMVCQELNDTYTDVTDKVSTHIPRPFPPFTREAPGHFFHDGKHYLLTSGTTGYYPNPSEMHSFDDFHGEWQDLGDPCVDDVHENSFNAQFSSVFTHPTIPNLYIALGDRWLTDMSVQMPDIRMCYEHIFNPEAGPMPAGIDLGAYTDANTSEADYVWLPIRFREDGTPYIAWVDKWRVEDFL